MSFQERGAEGAWTAPQPRRTREETIARAMSPERREEVLSLSLRDLLGFYETEYSRLVDQRIRMALDGKDVADIDMTLALIDGRLDQVRKTIEDAMWSWNIRLHSEK